MKINGAKKMKKVSTALLILSLLAGGLTAKYAIATGNGGVCPDSNPDPAG